MKNKKIVICGSILTVFLLVTAAFISPVTARESRIIEAVDIDERITNFKEQYQDLMTTILEDKELQLLYEALDSYYPVLQTRTCLSSDGKPVDDKNFELVGEEITIIRNEISNIIEEKYGRKLSVLERELALISDELKKNEDNTVLSAFTGLAETAGISSLDYFNSGESNLAGGSFYEEPITPVGDLFPLYVGPFFGLDFGNSKDWYAQNAQSTLYGGQAADGGTYTWEPFDPIDSDDDNIPVDSDTSGNLYVYPIGEEPAEPHEADTSNIWLWQYDIYGNLINIYYNGVRVDPDFYLFLLNNGLWDWFVNFIYNLYDFCIHISNILQMFENLFYAQGDVFFDFALILAAIIDYSPYINEDGYLFEIMEFFLDLNYRAYWLGDLADWIGEGVLYAGSLIYLFYLWLETNPPS